MDLALFFFKNQLRKIDVDTFNMMLDRDITLMDFFKDKMPTLDAVSHGLKILNVDTTKINFNIVLNSLAESNPAAYNLILKHPNGQKWLRNTIDDLKLKYSK